MNTMKIVSRGWKTVLLAIMVSVLSIARAADFPTGPIKIIVGFAPGGGSDTIARVIGKPLSDALGQPVIVENKPGAHGIVAGSTLARSPADGHTIMLGTTTTLPIAVAVKAKLPYDMLNDFITIGKVAETPIVLAVHPSLPVKSFAELAALLKKEQHSFGTFGAGSSAHLAGEFLRLKEQFKWTHIPYKGSGPLLNDLLAGHVKIGIMEATTVAPHVQSGKLRAIVVTSPRRAPSLPDLPTLAELGVPLGVSVWFGIVGPKGMPASAVARLNHELRVILESEAIRARFAEMGITPTPTTVAEFKTILESDIAAWSQVANEANIRAD